MVRFFNDWPFRKEISRNFVLLLLLRRRRRRRRRRCRWTFTAGSLNPTRLFRFAVAVRELENQTGSKFRKVSSFLLLAPRNSFPLLPSYTHVSFSCLYRNGESGGSSKLRTLIFMNFDSLSCQGMELIGSNWIKHDRLREKMIGKKEKVYDLLKYKNYLSIS